MQDRVAMVEIAGPENKKHGRVLCADQRLLFLHLFTVTVLVTSRFVLSVLVPYIPVLHFHSTRCGMIYDWGVL